MRPEIRDIGGHEFWSVAPLELRRTPDGDLEEYTHELEEGIRPNRHAAGPFCVMRLSAAPSAPGVYAIFVDAEVRYIGECQDLAARGGALGARVCRSARGPSRSAKSRPILCATSVPTQPNGGKQGNTDQKSSLT